MNTTVTPHAGSRARRLFSTVRVRISRKLWATYRIRQGNIVSRLLASLMAVFGVAAHALPTGLTVGAGTVTLNKQVPGSLTINQATQTTSLNWQSFGIGLGERVQFVQPNASAIAVNRVVGNEMSSIYGSLSSNGQVFLINPNGVLFGKTARVDVGSLVATSLAMSDADIAKRNYSLTAATGAGAVRNEGSITVAPKGYVVLSAPLVSNSGTINAPGGSIGLLAGSRATIDNVGDGLVRFSVDGAAAKALVENSGALLADGGSVLLSAHTLGDTLATAVNQTGVVRANTAFERNGIITLQAIGGDTLNSGTLEATGTATGQTGGSINVFGQRVGLIGNALVDVSGSAGGGTALVGGNWQGSGSEQRAEATVVQLGAKIKADALDAGNGGKVVVWADGGTSFAGAISAEGGRLEGNGGQVEVSGKRHLSFEGTVSTRAPKGKNGLLLLDPEDLCIQAANTTLCNSVDLTLAGGTPELAGAGGVFDTATAGTTSWLSAGTIGLLADGTNISLKATDGIYFNESIALPQATGSITFDAPIINMVSLNDATVHSLTATNAALAATFKATTLTLGTIGLNGGLLTLQVAGNGTQAGVISGAGGVTKTGAGTFTVSQLNTYGGNTTVSTGTVKLAGTGETGSSIFVDAGANFDLAGVNNAKNVTLSTSANLINSTGSATQSGTLNFFRTANIDVSGTSLDISGVITGSAAAQKNGSGTLTLSGANAAWNSILLINNGKVVATNDNSLGTNTGFTRVASSTATLELVNVNTSDVVALTPGATLLVTGPGNSTISGNLEVGTGAGSTTNIASGLTLNVGRVIDFSGAGKLIKAGAGTLAIGGPDVHTGATDLTAGTITQALDSAAAAINITGGTYTMAAGATLSATPTIAVAGALDLGGAAPFTVGAVTLNSGSISNGTLTSAAGYTVKAGSIGAVLAGAGGLTKSDATEVTLSAANTLTGATSVSDGTLTLASGGSLTSSDVTITAAKTLNLTANAEIKSLAGAAGSLVTLGANTLTVNSGGTTFSGTISGTGGLTKTGAGDLKLAEDNTYTGTTTVSGAGSITQSKASAATTVSITGGVASYLLDAAGTPTFAAAPTINVDGTLDLGTKTLTAGAVTLTGGSIDNGTLSSSTDFALKSGTVSAILAGTAGVAKTDATTVTLTGANTYTGATAITDGTLTLGAGGSAAGSAFTVAAGKTLDLGANAEIGSLAGLGDVTLNAFTLTTGSKAGDTSFGGVASGTGGITKVGATTTMTLAGANTYTGDTTVNAGTVKFGAGGSVGGDVVVGATGIFDLNGVDNASLVNLSANGAKLINSSATAAQQTGGVALGGDGEVNTTGNITIATLGVSGSGQLTKTGAGDLTIGAAGTNSGAITVNAGKLIATDNAALGTTAGSTSVANGATLEVRGITSAEAISMATGARLLASTADSTLSGGVALGAGAGSTVEVAGGIVATLSDVTGASGRLNKAGTGELVLTGSNTYSGDTFVDDGTLSLGAGGGIAGSAVTVAANKTLKLNANASVLSLTGPALSAVTLGANTLTIAGNPSTTFSGVIGGTGGVTKQGTGTLTLAGTNAYTGTTTISDGTVALAPGGGAVAGPVSIGATGTFDLAGGNNGTLVTMAANGATLANSSAGASQQTGGVVFTGDGNVSVANAAGSLSIATGAITGAGALTKTGPGTLTLAAANAAYTGNIVIAANGGTVAATNASSLGTAGGTTTVNNGGTLDLQGVSSPENVTVNAGGTVKASIGVNALGSLTGSGGDLTIDVTATSFALNTGLTNTGGNLIKTGAGALILGGDNTTSFVNTTINAGTLRANGGLALPNAGLVTINGSGILDLGANETIGTLAGASTATVALNANTLRTDGTGAAFNGTLTGAGGGIDKFGAGTLILGGNNTYTGTTTVSGGTLVAAGNNALGTVAGNTTVGPAATLEVRGVTTSENIFINGGSTLLSATGDSTLGGNITGTGALVKQGTGVLTLTGANSYGTTDVQGGTLAVTGAGTAGDGLIAIGSGATLDVRNGATVNAGSSGVITMSGGTLSASAGTGTINRQIEFGADIAVSAGAGATLTIDKQLYGFFSSGITKQGAGDVVLRLNAGTQAVTNGYNSSTRVTSGSLTLGSATGETSRTSTVIVNGGSFSTGKAGVFTGTPSIQLNAGSMTLAGSETVGAITGNAGTTLTQTAGTLTIDTAVTPTTFAGNIVGAGGLTKTGVGTQILSGSNTYAGTTLINTGTLAVAGGSAISDNGTVSLIAGTLRVDADETIGTLGGQGIVSLGANRLTTGGNNIASNFIGQATGTGGITKIGTATQTLGGQNTYTGSTIVNAGTLAINDFGIAGGNVLADTSAVVVNGGATLNVGTAETVGSLAGSGNVVLAAGLTAGANNTSTAFSGVVSGAGGFTKAGSGSLNLSGGNNYTGTTGATGGGAFTLNHVGAGGVNANLNNGSGAVTITATSVALAGTAGAVTSTTTGTTSLGNLTVASLNATSGGNVSQTGSLNATGALTVSAPGRIIALAGVNAVQGNIALTGARTDFSNTAPTTVALTTTGPTVINAAGQPLVISGSTGGQSLTTTAAATRIGPTASDTLSVGSAVINATGTVSQAAALTDTGNLTVNAAGQTIQLDSAANAITGTASLTGEATTLVNTLATTAALTTTGATTLTATGQTLTVTGNSGALTTNAAATNLGPLTGTSAVVNATGDVSTANAFTLTGALTVNAPGHTVAVGTAGVAGPAVAGPISVTGTALTLSNTGDTVLDAIDVASATILSSANVSQTPTSSLLVSGPLEITSTTGGINLPNAGNAVSGFVSLFGSPLVFTNSLDSNIGLNTTSDVTLSTPGHALTVSGNVGALTTTSTGLTLGTLTIASGNFTATGPVTQTGALTDAGALTVSAAGQPITLTNAGNAIGGVITLEGGVTSFFNGLDSNVVLNTTDTTTLTLAAGRNLTVSGTTNTASLTTNAAGTAVGALTVGSATLNASGAVTQTGALNDAGTLTVNAAGQVITLADAGNAITGPVTLNGAATSLVNSLDTTVSLNTTGDASVIAMTGRSLAVSGSTLGLTTTAGATSLGALSATSAAINASGAVTQTGALTDTGALTVNAAGQSVSLNNAGNAIAGVATLNGAATTLVNTLDTRVVLGTTDTTSLTASGGKALTVSGSTGTASLTTTAGATSLGALTAGNVSVNATGAVSQTGALAANDLAVNAAGQTVTLAQAGNAIAGNIDLTGAATSLTNTLDSDVFLATTGATTINTGSKALVVAGSTGGAALATTAGATELGALNVGSAAVAAGGAVTQTGALASTGAVSINAAGQPITLGNAGNAIAGPVTLTGTTATLVNTVDSNVTLATTGATTLTATGRALNVSGSSGALTTTAAATTLGTLSASSATLNATGAVGQTGALTDAGALTVNAAGQNIDLSNAANAVTGPVALTGATTRFTNTRDTTATLNATGAATVVATGRALTVTGSMTGPVALTGAATSLTNTQNTTVALTTTGPTSVTATGRTLAVSGSSGALTTNAGATALGTLAASSATLNASGAVTQTGALTDTGALTVNSAGQAITLGNAGNAITGPVTLNGAATTLVNTVDSTVALATTGATTLNSGARALTLSGSTGGSTLTTTAGATTLGALSSGDATLNASGAISQTGALNDSGTLTVNAAGQAVNLGNAGNSIAGPVTLRGAATTLVNTRDTTATLATTGATSLNVGARALTISGSTGTGTLTTTGAATTLGALSTGGGTLNASGNVTQTAALVATGPLTVNASGQSAAFDGQNNDFAALTVNAANASVKDINGLGLGGNVSGTLKSTSGALEFSTTTAGTLDVTATDNVTQKANSPVTVTGSTTIVAVGKTVDLSTSVNALSGPITPTAKVFKLSNSKDITINVAGVADDLALTTTTASIQLNGSGSTEGGWDGLTLELAGAPGLVVGNDVNSIFGNRFLLGKRVLTVNYAPTDATFLFQPSNQSTKINGVDAATFALSRDYGGLVTGPRGSAEERQAQKRTAGIGVIEEKVKANTIGLAEVTAPLVFKEFEQKSPECLKEQADGVQNPPSCK